MESFTSAVKTLIKTNKDFPQKFKQRLVLESHNVTSPFKLLVGLVTEGVLSDGSSNTEASVGLKEVIVELAMMIVCSKGADAIGGLTKALEESGNLRLISALRTWIKEDFATETEGNISEPKGAAAGQTGISEKPVKEQMKISTESESNTAKLIDMIVSHTKDDFMEKLEGHWLGKASRIVNVPEFCSILARQKVLNESEIQPRTEMEPKQQWAEKTIKVALSKRAIASIVLAFQLSGNDGILQETQEWLETSQVTKKNYPISVKGLPKQLRHVKPTVGMSRFFEQAPPFDDIQKVATFSCSPNSFRKGKSTLKFNKDKMTAAYSEGTLKMWNWRENEETTIKLGDKVRGITALQYDEEILVLGTEAGTVHLFDPKMLEEQWAVRFGEPVHSLQIADSTLVVATRHGDEGRLWWVEISRSDMRLLNRRLVVTVPKNTDFGFFIDNDNSFVYYSNVLLLRYTKSGEPQTNCWGAKFSLEAPTDINTLTVVDLVGCKSFVVAGCKDGVIATWDTPERFPSCKPDRTFQGQQDAIVGLSSINGHLLSVCEDGKLLMWSGYDLKNKHATPIPRVLAENFRNVTSLVACERWFASTSSKDRTINIWTLPDFWLRTG